MTKLSSCVGPKVTSKDQYIQALSTFLSVMEPDVEMLSESIVTLQSMIKASKGEDAKPKAKAKAKGKARARGRAAAADSASPGA